MSGRLICYARCSTDEQKAGLEQQIRELTAAGGDLIFNEEVSSVAERKELDAALAEMRKGDKLVVCKIDRLARSVIGLWKIIDVLEKKGCGLRILNFGGEVVDTRGATGKLILTIFAAFAQFEREMMLERQRVGITKAQIEGKYRGRKPTSMEKRERVIDMHADGRSVIEMAKDIGVSRITVYRILQSEGLCDAPTRSHPYRRFVPRRVDAQSALPAA